MKTEILLLAFLAGLIVFAVGPVRTAAQFEEFNVAGMPDVIYVPTPTVVVEEMLRMAAVKPGEMVYDLGCGDGRIVIAAARDFGARGIGVDIDPKRIAESKANAEKAGITDRVQFQQADLFTMNFSDADVVMLYLLPALNVRLRPRLLDELRPGTRIVSHAFMMGDWQPDERAQVGNPEKSVYYWVIPAKVAGDWRVRLPDGKEGTLSLQQEYQVVSGTLQRNGQSLPVTKGRLKGAQLTFSVGEGAQATNVTANVTGDRFAGAQQQGMSNRSDEWTGERR